MYCLLVLRQSKRRVREEICRSIDLSPSHAHDLRDAYLLQFITTLESVSTKLNSDKHISGNE